MITVPKFGQGDDLTTEYLAKLADAIRELQGLAVLGVQPPLSRAGNTILFTSKDKSFWAIVDRRAPPLDYDDEEYWVYPAKCTSTGTGPTVFAPEDDAEAVTATNLSAANGHAHDLPKGTVVRVYSVEDAADPPNTEYVFWSAQPAVFPVLVSWVGGGAGDVYDNCTFVYAMKDLDGNTIIGPGGAPFSPTFPRFPGTEYTLPSADSPGLAYWDGERIQLLIALEEWPVTDLVTVVTAIEVDPVLPQIRYSYTTARVLDMAGVQWTDWMPIPMPPP